MAKPTLFISDLHLCADRPAITELFLKFLQNDARRAQALYILGDLFEYWIGDEAATLDEHRPTIEALRALAESGVPTQIIPGNRDFLLGADFARASGCPVLPDPTCIDLYGTPVLLMHGDSLCTRDVEYMAFRKMVRERRWQREFLDKPYAEREAIARRYREISKETTSQKKPEIMDVTQGAVEEIMRTHRIRHLIHGHTHRPAEHVFNLDGASAYRTVLGDWYEQGSVLRVTPTSRTLESLPL